MNHVAHRQVLGIVGLFSVLILSNLRINQTVHADNEGVTESVTADTDPNLQNQNTVKLSVSTNESQSQDVANNTVITQAQAAGTIADAAFQLTNQHYNPTTEADTNRSMGSVLNSAALAAMTDEKGSTSTHHILRMPNGLDEAAAGKWLAIAKQKAIEDQSNTGRSQQIIMVSATSGQRKAFAIGADTSVPRVDAVDVSSYQSWMTQANYNQLKAAGVQSVVIKISQNTNYSNPYAATQIKYAQAAGLTVSVYHFAQFTNADSAHAEASKTISTMKNLGLSPSTLIFADMEDNSTNTSNVASNLNAYWATLNASGYTNHGVYTGGLFGPTYAAQTSGTVGAKKTWFAQYPDTPSKNNMMNSQYGAWQFSSTSYLSGYPNNAIDSSHDYAGLLNAKNYDKVISTKTVNLPGKVNQTTRADGFYSAPYNTDAATTTPNSNGKTFNGQTVQVLEEATTSRNANTGNTFYKIRFVNGKTYWTDTRAISVGSFYTMTNKKTVNYRARIDQINRQDGLYPDGPYKTALSNVYENSNAPRFNRQIVPVTQEATTPNGTYCQITLNNGAVEWIDKRGLSDNLFDRILSSKALNKVGRISQTGRSDGLYPAAYNTNASSTGQNSGAKARDGQPVTILQEVTTERDSNLGNQFYEVRFNDGTTEWIDVRGVAMVATNKIVNRHTVDLAGIIAQAGRADGLYSAPWNTDSLTITGNQNAKAFDGQLVQIISEATTDRSANIGNTFYEIELNNGRKLWIDSHGIQLKTLDTVTNLQPVKYTAQIVQSNRKDGLYNHPYNTDADSIFPNTAAQGFNGRGVTVTALGTTRMGTYAMVTLPDGSVKWIDQRGLRPVTYDKVQNFKSLSGTGIIRQTGRTDGLYSAPYFTDAMSILSNSNAKLFDGQRVILLSQTTTTRDAGIGNVFDQIQLSNGNVYWIDARGISIDK